MHVLLLGVPLYEGMAGSVRVRNLLDPMIQERKISWSNLYFSKQAGNFKENGDSHVKEVEVDLKKPKSILKFFSDAFGFIKLRRVKGDLNLFYAYDTPDLKNIFLILYAKLLGYKIVLDLVEDNSVAASYGGFLNKLRIKSGQYLLKSSPLYGDLFIGISNHLFLMLSVLVKDLSRVMYIPVTVDLEKIKVSECAEKQGMKIFYGGSFGKKDGIEYLIGGFEKVHQNFPEAELILTGKIDDTKYLDGILQKYQTKKVRDKIKYLGFLSSEEYLKVLGECDVFCVTRNNSQAANTGFPSKLAEFLASGKAVVASDVGDVGKLLQNGKELLLVPPEDEQALANALTLILNDRSLVDKLGQAGRRAANEIFDNKKYSALLFERMNSLN